MQSELEQKELYKLNLIRNAAARSKGTTVVNKSQDVRMHMLKREAEANELEDDHENSSANQNMTALNTQYYLKNNSEQDSVPRNKDVNHSMQINERGK